MVIPSTAVFFTVHIVTKNHWYRPTLAETGIWGDVEQTGIDNAIYQLRKLFWARVKAIRQHFTTCCDL